VPREETVKGYEIAKDEYVRFEPEELKTLEQAFSSALVIDSFVPEGAIDPVYFEDTYYLPVLEEGEARPLSVRIFDTPTARIALGTGYVLAGRLDEAVVTASRVAELAAERGFRGTQATVSHLLGEISARRDPPGGGRGHRALWPRAGACHRPRHAPPRRPLRWALANCTGAPGTARRPRST
jgi:Ku70/Ku80 beta-barrel domain